MTLATRPFSLESIRLRQDASFWMEPQLQDAANVPVMQRSKKGSIT
jgi:hypothetical protein